MDDLLNEFLTETSESLSTLDAEVVKLEQNPNHPGLVDNIFRLVHTIKGTCGFLGLPRLEAVAHSAENVLGKIRDGDLTVTPAGVSLILASLDRIKDILGALEATESEPEGNDGELIELLDAMAEGVEVPAPDVPPAVEEPAPTPVDDGIDPSLDRNLKAGEVGLDELERIFQETEGPETPAASAPTSEPVAEAAPEAGANVESEPASATNGGSSVANQSIRVNVDQLETLMTMVSELVLTRNQLLQMVRTQTDSEFKVPLQRLSHVTTELQEGVMKTRMQPIGNAWAQLPRIIRDLGHELGKKIDLRMIGSETELDRQVLELIKDPLTHMVRNSVDHGLEGGAERRAAGKPETGHISLNAYHEGGHILIEISDDGAGLDVEKLKSKIIEKELASTDECEGMTDQQIMQFIFKAGFSTAQTVTSVSGRGVGMDVVRTNIEKIGGTIDLRSQRGKGTTFTIKIPLTLAIVSALIVECRSERFAIPQLSVVELVRASKHSENQLEMINDAAVLRLRNRLLPLVDLGDCLKLPRAEGDDRESIDVESEAYIVVTQVGAYTFGIVVDQVSDAEEIVVKPVAPLLRDISMFSGNTILGDGSVIMILDPNGISAETTDSAVREGEAETQVETSSRRTDDAMSFLVFRVGGDEPKAVPLSLVARLEEIERDSIESANGRLVVQYRGQLMPLVTLNAGYELAATGRQSILVFSDNDYSMGLVVDEIIDIVEDRLNIELGSDRAGFMGSAVIDGNATEILDVAHFLEQASDNWFKRHGDQSFGQKSGERHVLLVDDSPSFRNMLTPLLQVAGYTVTSVEDAGQALELREHGESFDVIISDIEMPGMDGFDFAEEVKRDGLWQETPILALSSHASPSDFQRGREAGFNDYVAKFDRDALLDSLSQTIAMNGGAA